MSVDPFYMIVDRDAVTRATKINVGFEDRKPTVYIYKTLAEAEKAAQGYKDHYICEVNPMFLTRIEYHADPIGGAKSS